MFAMHNHFETVQYSPRLIAWEVTRRCNMHCQHCRAGACDRDYPGELSTQECRRVLDNISSFSSPIIILTGGEPMLRPDIYEIASYGSSQGLRMVMAPCGYLVDDGSVAKMKESGIECISLSIDGASAESHDAFRATEGAFDRVRAAAVTARDGGLDFQINTTITRGNLAELPAIMELARELGAVTFNPFLLVPTGRGEALADQELSADQYESTLTYLAGCDSEGMAVRVTCGPHFQRITRQLGNGRQGSGHPGGGKVQGAGCMGGKSFAFISHVGRVQICGFLEESAGELKENGFDFESVWRDSEFFRKIRDVDSYSGKCGYCEYRKVCGGCRARAWAADGDWLGSEPYCSYEPEKKR